MVLNRKNFLAVFTVAVGSVGAVIVGINENIIEYYCSLNSLFLSFDLSKNIYCGTVVIITHIIFISSLFMMAIFIIAKLLSAIPHIDHKKRTSEIDLNKLKLADSMLRRSSWVDYDEYSLTLINDTGGDIKRCYVMLDEVLWKNFKGRWEVMEKEVYSKPFKPKISNTVDGKIDLDNRDRVDFVFISHNEYPILNSTINRNEIETNFDFVFFGDEHINIGYGPDLRLKISIRGKDENEKNFEPILYDLYLHLKKHHGIPKVDITKIKRINK